MVTALSEIDIAAIRQPLRTGAGDDTEFSG
jgi:hypothetical protein